jgi:hypothetical protein
MQIASKDAAWLMQEGVAAFSQIELNGIRIDAGYLKQHTKETEEEIAALKKRLYADKMWKRWERKFGTRATLGNRSQLGDLVFGEMGYARRHTLAKRDKSNDEENWRHKPKNDEAAFGNASKEIPFVADYFRWHKLEKMHGTYLLGFQREAVNGRIHPFFDLHKVRTYRSCVAKGTTIEVVRDVSKYPKGYRIEDVRAGDHVYCYDDQMKLTIRKVLWAGKTGHRKVVRLHWVAARGRKGYVDVTPEHRIRMYSGQYVRAEDIRPGMDFRGPMESKRAPKIRCAAMTRDGERLYETGNIEPLLDHRLIYESLVGELQPFDHVHHKDKNHLNNLPENLQRLTASEHSRYHSPEYLTDEGRRKGVKNRVENHRLYGNRFAKGEQCGQWVKMSKYQFLKRLARAGGKVSRTAHDFLMMKRRAELFGVDLRAVKLRYNKNGYINKGLLTRLWRQGRTVVMRTLEIDFYKTKTLLEQRGLSTSRKWGNQFGEFVPNNHKIVAVEWLKDPVDVYDLEVEEHHNFIANEVCVHNSSSWPNFTNIPNRQYEIAKRIRRCFIPDEGCDLGEFDYGLAEVRSACVYTKDPRLIEDFTTEGKDAHGDTAMELFGVTAEMVKSWTEEQKKKWKGGMRDWSKNRFVFPQFFGSVACQCAPHIWEAVDSGAMMPDGKTTVKMWLVEQGITELGDCDPEGNVEPGTFVHRVKTVEDEFWNKRFKVYSAWKKRWWNSYLTDGYFKSLSGFVFTGIYGRNECWNYPVQSFAFHWLLYAIIVILKEIKKRKMRTKLVGAIHDCVVASIPCEERDEFCDLVVEVMTKRVPKHWPVINVDLKTEVELCPEGVSWSDKKVARRTAKGIWEIPK